MNKELDFDFNENIKSYVDDRKIKKFFRITIPILIVEILALLAMGIYYILLPKNYCKISTNMKDAVVYVNNKETKKFRMDNPTQQTEHYYYEIDVSIKLPGEDTYQLEFTLSCDKYKITASTTAQKRDEKYSMMVKGGEKTQILSAITILSPEIIKNFNVKLDININRV